MSHVADSFYVMIIKGIQAKSYFVAGFSIQIYPGDTESCAQPRCGSHRTEALVKIQESLAHADTSRSKYSR